MPDTGHGTGLPLFLAGNPPVSVPGCRTSLSTSNTTMRNAAASPIVTSFGKGYLICLIGTVIWSFTGILIRYLTETYHLPPLVLAIWRDLFVSLGLAAGLGLVNPRLLKIERSQVRFIFLFGFVISLFNSIWTFSVSLNGAAVATVLAYSSPAFTALLGWRLFGERLDWFKGSVILAVMLGCTLVSGAYDPVTWSFNPLGILTGLLSGVAFAVYSLMGKTASQRGLNPWSSLLYAFGIATLFLFSYHLIPGMLVGSDPLTELFWLGGSWDGWGILLLLGIGPTIGGYGLYTLSLSYLPMSIASLIASLEPAFTAMLAYLLLAERMSPIQIVGSLVIFFSVLLLRLRGER